MPVLVYHRSHSEHDIVGTLIPLLPIIMSQLWKLRLKRGHSQDVVSGWKTPGSPLSRNKKRERYQTWVLQSAHLCSNTILPGPSECSEWSSPMSVSCAYYPPSPSTLRIPFGVPHSVPGRHGCSSIGNCCFHCGCSFYLCDLMTFCSGIVWLVHLNFLCVYYRFFLCGYG